MKKKLLLAIIVLFSFMLIPTYTSAKSKATVYLFRGKGCGYCRALLTFLNDSNDEIGKYYELKSYEVWNNSDNAELMKNISNFLEQPAQGVPYLIIGNKDYNKNGLCTLVKYNITELEILKYIKSEIKKLYETDKDKRYDVIEEYKKSNELTKTYKTKNLKEAVEEEGMKYNAPGKKSSKNVSSVLGIIINAVVTVLSASAVIVFINCKFKKLNEKIDASVSKTSKVTKK